MAWRVDSLQGYLFGLDSYSNFLFQLWATPNKAKSGQVLRSRVINQREE
jgi:hypothetical protein